MCTNHGGMAPQTLLAEGLRRRQFTVPDAFEA